MDPDGALVERVRAGDENAFVDLVRRYQPRLLRLARTVVPSSAVAEEVAQDTWLAVVRGVDRFEGRSSFKTWLFHICMNRARSALSRELRAGTADETGMERFDANGRWVASVEPWAEQVDDRLLAEELVHRVPSLLQRLPRAQREVVLLRDVEGLSSSEAAGVAGLTLGHQRVLLHRGRAQLRALLAAEMGKS